MKIADFFIALGFDIKGAPDVDKTDQSVEKLTFSSIKLLGIVTALNAAFYTMMKQGVDTGVALQRFALLTGLPIDQLQRYEQTAARGNVQAGAMAQAIGAIQKARAAIAFGNAEAAAPWMLLGIDPRQDPFKVLEQLRQQVLRLDPAIARAKLGEMGLGDDVMYLLKQNLGKGNLDQRVTVTDEEARRLAALGGAWKEFLFTLGQVGARFAAQFAEPIAAVLNQLTKALTLVGRFTDWLERGGTGADIFKYSMLGLLAVLAGLNVALVLLLTGPGGAFFGMIVALGVLLGGLVLLVQDFWVALRGGKTAFDWNDNLILTVKNVEALAKWLGKIVDLFDMIKNRSPSSEIGKAFKEVTGMSAAWNWYSDMARTRVVDSQRGGNWNAPIDMTVNVQGGADPHATGRDVGRAASRQISDALGQMPAPSR